MAVLFPWLQSIIDDVNKAQRIFKKKKKINHYIRRKQEQAKKAKTLARVVKLKVVRRTRFCSAYEVTRAFNVNCEFARELLASEAWQEITRPKGKAPCKKVEVAEGLWRRTPTWERSKRAQAILEPIKAFTRKAGLRDLSSALPSWFQMEKKLTKVTRKMDFVDRNKREEQGVKQQRQEGLAEKMQSRREDFLRPEHCAAFCLNPLIRKAVLYQEDGAAAWLVHLEACIFVL